MAELFDQKPRVFRNKELIYSNAIAKIAEEMGCAGILCEGVDHFLGDRNPDFS